MNLQVFNVALLNSHYKVYCRIGPDYLIINWKEYKCKGPYHNSKKNTELSQIQEGTEENTKTLSEFPNFPPRNKLYFFRKRDTIADQSRIILVG